MSLKSISNAALLVTIILGVSEMSAAFADTAPRLKLNGIKGEDDRVRVDISAYPWNTIGRINKEGSFCTGVLVGKNKILTAAHCFWNKKTRRWSAAKYFHFVLGYEKGAYKAAAKGVSYQTAFKKLPDLTVQPLGRENDWAILTIDKSLGAQYGFVPVSSKRPATFLKKNKPKGNVIQAGYSRDYAHVLTVHKSCFLTDLGTLKGEKSPIYFHKCDATNGDSGSPLFFKSKEKYELIGIHSATTRSKKQPVYGIAVPSSSFLKALNADL